MLCVLAAGAAHMRSGQVLREQGKREGEEDGMRRTRSRRDPTSLQSVLQ